VYEYNAYVNRVIDGDTIECSVDLGFHIQLTVRFRLLGIDCPEVRGPTRDAGLAAAAYTRSRLEGRRVYLRSSTAPGGSAPLGADSFGRWLARVYLDDEDFNQTLLDGGYAVPFK